MTWGKGRLIQLPRAGADPNPLASPQAGGQNKEEKTMARTYKFGAEGVATTNRATYYGNQAGCENATANQGLNIDPGCATVPKLCNWTTLPGYVEIPAGQVRTMTVVSPIAQFFDIHAASFVVINANDCTLNLRSEILSVTYNSRQLEDYNIPDGTPGGVLIDAAYMEDNGPTPVNWMAGTTGNNQVLEIRIRNICATDAIVYAVFYGNPTDTCPV